MVGRTNSDTDRLIIRALRAAASAYSDEVGEEHWERETRLLRELPRKPRFSKADLIDIAWWKTDGRDVHWVEDNRDEAIQWLTGLAFHASEPADAIRTLAEGVEGRRLTGVAYPMASAILMFHEPSRHTVLDPRAWSVLHEMGLLGPVPEDWNAEHYARYRARCVGLKKPTGLNLRRLDRALWLLGGSMWLLDLLIRGG